MSNKTKLSSTVTVERYRELAKNGDRDALARFIRDRFYERYIRPIESIPASEKHGFMIMAVCCLMIETLESFYQGLGSTRNDSGRMFRNFFARDTAFKVFAGNGWFYADIRCGILHLGEARNGWRIVRRGQLIDTAEKKINATRFLRELCKVVDDYADQLRTDDNLWGAFKKKMAVVCENCN